MIHRQVEILFIALMVLTAGSGSAQESGLDFAELWARSHYPERSGDILVVPREGDIITSNPDPYMHGTPWDYDARVPFILYGPGKIRPGHYDGPAAHRDLGATVTSLLGLPPLAGSTGRVVSEAIQLSAGPPAVIALIVLDAFRWDFFDRYADSMPNLVWIREEGATFDNARAGTLPTSTSVAHTTIATATDPRFHGITGNYFYDRINRREIHSYANGSPRNLVTLTFADRWNAETGGQAVIVAQGGTYYTGVALAGHGACIFGGRPVIVSWLDGDGGWSTNSECYTIPDEMAAIERTAALDTLDVLEMEATVSPARSRPMATTLARFEGDGVIALLDGQPFGADSITDLLLVNLKAADKVGHLVGPFSPGEEAAVAEIDRQIGRIVAGLEEKTGDRGFVLALTADHGMPDDPPAGRRQITHAEVRDLLDDRFDPDGPGIVLSFRSADTQIHLDRPRLAELGLTIPEVARYLSSQPFIHSAYWWDPSRGDVVRAEGEEEAP